MKKLKKILSFFLVGVIAVTSMICGSVTAGADSVYSAYYAEIDSTPTVQINGISKSEMDFILEKSQNGVIYAVAKFGDGDDAFTLGYTYYLGFVQYTNTDIVKSGYFLALDTTYNFVFELKPQTSSNKKYYDKIKNAKTCKITLGVTDESGKVVNYNGRSELFEVNFFNMNETSTSSTKTTDYTIRIYRAISGSKVKLYIDGLNDTFFKKYNKKHSIKSNSVSQYYIKVSPDNALDSFTFFVDSKDYNKTTKVDSSMNFENAEYYTINSDQLTSGFCITVTDKNIVNKLKSIKKIYSIYVSSTSTNGYDSESLRDNDFSNYDFTIKTVTEPKKSISDLKVASISSKTYTGKARKPAVAVTDGSKTLKYGTDYTLSYSNNTNIGTATVTIKGKGDYTGSKKVTFKIVPPKTTLTAKKSGGKYTLSWKAVSGIDKYQIQYSADKGRNYKSAGTIAASKTKASLNLDSDASYIFRIRSYKKVDGKTYYSEWAEYDPTPKAAVSYDAQQPFDVYVKYSGNTAYIYFDGIDDKCISLYNQNNGYKSKDISGYCFGLTFYDDNENAFLYFHLYTKPDYKSIEFLMCSLTIGSKSTDFASKVETEYYTNKSGLSSGFCMKLTDKTAVSYIKKIKPSSIEFVALNKSGELMDGKYRYWTSPIIKTLSK